MCIFGSWLARCAYTTATPHKNKHASVGGYPRRRRRKRWKAVPPPTVPITTCGSTPKRCHLCERGARGVFDRGHPLYEAIGQDHLANIPLCIRCIRAVQTTMSEPAFTAHPARCPHCGERHTNQDECEHRADDTE